MMTSSDANKLLIEDIRPQLELMEDMFRKLNIGLTLKASKTNLIIKM